MKKFLRNHQEYLLPLVSAALLLTIGGWAVWSVRAVIADIETVTSVGNTALPIHTFNIDQAKQIRILSGPTP